ncbi:MAG TPA: patatin-like phospholipase family protein, partial [Ideonella sp.]|nr:patatin-like phospholipase family protein [Ideonella sp.]
MDPSAEVAAALPWADAERAALRERRSLAGVDAGAPTVGLAISGGGVRSATFGLGLLRGMARAGLLPRIDYLSTVSGGGFVGAMYGRLVSRLGVHAAQAVLARDESPVLEWLRRNGRYLAPAGARDLGIAVVTYLRAMIAIHGESLLTGLLFAVLVMTPHLLQQAGPRFDAAHWEPWRTLWWPLALALWLALAPGLMSAYWVARDAPDPNLRRVRPPLRDLMFLVVLAAGLVAATAVASTHLERVPLAGGEGGPLLAAAALLVGWSCWLGLLATPLALALADVPHALAVARQRNRLTRWLRRVSLLAALLALLGLLDVVSWWVLEGLEAGEVSVWGGVGLGGIVVLVLRAFAQPLQQFVARADNSLAREWGSKALHVAGVIGLLVLLCAWLVAAQWLVFSPEPLLALRDLSPGVRAFGLLAVGVLWLVLTASNDQMANASSLHSFYRARLTRAYLAVGNPLRGLATPGPAPLPAHAAQRDVTRVLDSDDLDIRDYRPEAAGGPLHLVNTCLNQTRDDASGLYNADRKGTLVTIGARGLEIGPALALPLPPKTDGLDPGDEIGTLGRWVAISGAAAAPGAGSYTSRGWALLLFFLGVRLGYWMRAPRVPAGGWPPGVAALWRWLVKPVMLASEASATFWGTSRPWWYLSDGGHFENTGVYALLRRRVDFIVLADDGADPDYDFADLENLVRKARIDFGAEIEFYTREEAAQLFAAPTDALTVLSPEDMADNHAARGVLLARVRYPAGADGTRDESTLLVVKPDLHDALDLDVLGYAERHPAFPQEPTGDQSFDEAQWESYQRLGEDFGAALRPEWLTQLPGWSVRREHPLTVSARLHAQGAPASTDAGATPLW